MTDAARKVALVIGAGDATGGAIARRFAREGYIACVTRRPADKLQPLVEQIRAEGARRMPSAATHARKKQVSLVETIERDIAPIEVAVFNIGANVRFGITEDTARATTRYGRWPASRLPDGPRDRQRWCPAATAPSLHGRHRQPARARSFAAFAGAKHALRALAQSMARELWPKNIHVAHTVIDGAIDTEWIRQQLPRPLRAEGPGRHPPARTASPSLLADPPAAARRLVARDRTAAVDGELVNPDYCGAPPGGPSLRIVISDVVFSARTGASVTSMVEPGPTSR